MRHTIAHGLLTGLVVALVVSNLTLATRINTLRDQLTGQVSGYGVQTSTTPTPIPLAITILSPDYGPVGTKVIVQGSGFAATGNTVFFDYHQIPNTPSYDGITLSFLVPEYVSFSCTSSSPCPTNDWHKVMPGSHTVAVGNLQGKSNGATFVVTEALTVSKKVKIMALKPTSGLPGVQVAILGSGFTRTNNTVWFNYHKIGKLSSNGRTIGFTVPYELVYSCQSNVPCPTSTLKKVIPGDYKVAVQNSRGTSNSLVFTVLPAPTPNSQ